MKYKRSSGILMHPTSFPGPDGMGDLGPEAYRWINFLKDSGCGLWQVLPLGPTGYGDSPYQCFSAFAGNPYLISPTLLFEDGLLTRADLADRPNFPDHMVEFGRAIQWKLTLLERAYLNFKNLPLGKITEAFSLFVDEEAYWLDDFALFMAIKKFQGGVSWSSWPQALRKREPSAINRFKLENPLEIDRIRFQQFIFFRQWRQLKDFAHNQNIQIIGDIPIFVAYDSADVWANPELFYLDQRDLPSVVAGVPPDYFSPTGQLWGNPLYRWPLHDQQGYSWWIKRIQATLKTVDIIRLDHFRGFCGYWEVPFGKPTAENGRWVEGPGSKFIDAVQHALGDLPLIAEDLGEITPDVIELRDRYSLPGMKICQFAFGSDSSEPFLPHNYPQNCVAYTGTHDNDTVLGWYQTAPEKERDFCRRYLGRSGDDISWDLIRAVWSSVAVLALAPMQDLLKLDNASRMNFPGRPSGNWTWRMLSYQLSPEISVRIREMNTLYSRLPESNDMKLRPPLQYAQP